MFLAINKKILFNRVINLKIISFIKSLKAYKFGKNKKC